MVQDEALLTMADQYKNLQSRIWSIDRRYLQLPWTTSNSDSKVAPILDVEYGII